MTRLFLVRHGRAAAGWDTDPDPGLDGLGRAQATEACDRLAPLGPLEVLSSPLLRCRQTAEPLAQTWKVSVRIEPLVAEIPSPEGIDMGDRVEWLRTAMRGTWSQLGPRYSDFRAGVIRALTALEADAVVFSHFVAINAAIGSAVGDDRLVIRSLDNGSTTVLDVVDGSLRFVEGGHEADTLIR